MPDRTPDAETLREALTPEIEATLIRAREFMREALQQRDLGERMTRMLERAVAAMDEDLVAGWLEFNRGMRELLVHSGGAEHEGARARRPRRRRR